MAQVTTREYKHISLDETELKLWRLNSYCRVAGQAVRFSRGGSNKAYEASRFFRGILEGQLYEFATEEQRIDYGILAKNIWMCTTNRDYVTVPHRAMARIPIGNEHSSVVFADWSAIAGYRADKSTNYYYCDDDGFEFVTPFVLRLPHNTKHNGKGGSSHIDESSGEGNSRWIIGFVEHEQQRSPNFKNAGSLEDLARSMTGGVLICRKPVDGDQDDAIREAEHIAEQWAEQRQEERRYWDAGRQVSDILDQVKEVLKEAPELKVKGCTHTKCSHWHDVVNQLSDLQTDLFVTLERVYNTSDENLMSSFRDAIDHTFWDDYDRLERLARWELPT